MTARVHVFVQARMSSRRFPGKVLAPFHGEPIVRHVLRRVEQALPDVPIVVATSSQPSDDPLAAYVDSLGAAVCRGPLERVFDRFRRCVEAHPCDWILRVSADSPLISGDVLRAVVAHSSQPCDLVTTIFPRTFPQGHNAELIRVSTFMSIDPRSLTPEQQEHVTPVYYSHADRFSIVSVESGRPELRDINLCVDTVDDLRRLEDSAEVVLKTVSYEPLLARTP